MSKFLPRLKKLLEYRDSGGLLRRWCNKNFPRFFGDFKASPLEIEEEFKMKHFVKLELISHTILAS